MILRIHDLIQWSTPLWKSHKKQILAIGFPSTQQLVKYIYGLESLMEVVLQHSCVHDIIRVLSAHQSYTDECTSHFLCHFKSYHLHSDQWVLYYKLTWPLAYLLKISTAVLQDHLLLFTANLLQQASFDSCYLLF